MHTKTKVYRVKNLNGLISLLKDLEWKNLQLFFIFRYILDQQAQEKQLFYHSLL